MEIIKINGLFYLKNTTLTNYTYKLYPTNDCCDCQDFNPITGNINANSQVLLALTFDTNYTVQVLNGSTVVETLTFNYFPNLRNRLVEDTKAMLCGDDCQGCDNDILIEELGNLIKYKNLINEFLSYYLLNTYLPEQTSCENTKGLLFVQEAANLYSCDIITGICTQLHYSDYTNKPTGSLELFKKILSIYFLGIYFYERKGLTVQSEIDYIDSMFDICKIKKCIKKLGIDFDELEAIFESVIADTCACTDCPDCPECPPSCPENLPPTAAAIVSIDILDARPNIIGVENFLKGYSDPEDDFIYSLRIDEIVWANEISETQLSVYINGSPIEVGMEIGIFDLVAGYFAYEAQNVGNALGVVITYSVADAGSREYGAQGTITIVEP